MSFLIFGILWSLLLLVGYAGIAKAGPRFSISSPGRAVGVILALALIVRLVPNFFLPVGAVYDIDSFQMVGDSVLRGQEVYTATTGMNRFPYLPFQMYWAAIAAYIANFTGVAFVKIIRLAPILADAAVAVLLYKKISEKDAPEKAFFAALLFALNPVSVFVSAYHGQFDAVPAFLTLAALYTVNTPWIAGSLLGLGIYTKSWPVLAFPNLINGKKHWVSWIKIGFMASAIPLGSVLVYAVAYRVSPWLVLERALGYNWGMGIWGYTYIIRAVQVAFPPIAPLYHFFLQNGRYLTLGLLGLVWVLKGRKLSPIDGFLTTLVAFFAVTHAFSIQYLAWLIPFAVAGQDYRWLHRFTLAAFAYMFLAYHTLIMSMQITNLLPWPQADMWLIIPAGLPAWLVVVAWLRERLVSSKNKLPAVAG